MNQFLLRGEQTKPPQVDIRIYTDNANDALQVEMSGNPRNILVALCVALADLEELGVPPERSKLPSILPLCIERR